MSDRKAVICDRKSSASDGMNLACDLDPDLEPAVAEARAWAARLQKAAHRGVGDRDHSVRHRVARETGVPESYLLRLHKRARSMPDVSGKYARLLRLACERLDAASARADARRLTIESEISALRTSLLQPRSEVDD